MTCEYTLGEIAEALGAQVSGDPNRRVRGLQTLTRAGADQLSFFANTRYQSDLKQTAAAAVLVSEGHRPLCPVDALVMDNPYLGFARLSHWFDNRPQVVEGIHPTAVVSPQAVVSSSASVGAYAVIEAGADIGDNVLIGSHCVIGAGSSVGEDSRLASGVVLYHGVQVGRRALIHSAVVIGSDGFGFANDQGRWQKIAQLGSVIIGDDVEIGAGTTIDRGALEDTRIGNGVKLDNQIQIAHNVEIGDDCAFAGCVGVAGSAKIGRRCTLAGGVVVAGHLELAEGVHISAMGLVTKSLKTPGIYSSGTGISPHQQWKRNVVRFRQLDQLAGRINELEKRLDKASD